MCKVYVAPVSLHPVLSYQAEDVIGTAPVSSLQRGFRRWPEACRFIPEKGEQRASANGEPKVAAGSEAVQAGCGFRGALRSTNRTNNVSLGHNNV